MVKNNKTHEFQKVMAIVIEVEASFQFISEGLKVLNKQNYVSSNNHVALQLLSAGIERTLKILLLLKDRYLDGRFPELQKTRERFRTYDNGHGIEKMLDELIQYSKSVDSMQNIPILVDDMEYLEFDPNFRTFVEVITDFSIYQRYYYIDTIVSATTNYDINAFEVFRKLMDSYLENVDRTQMTYEQEAKFCIKNTIICIEKGVRALSRFFTHGLGDEGRKYYNDFSNFIFLRDEKLGLLEYTEKKKWPSDMYKPMSILSVKFITISIFSKSKTLYSRRYPDWPFTVNCIKVYSYKSKFSKYYFINIDGKIYALTGSTSSQYKIPIYFKTNKLKPKAYALYLLEEAKLL